MLYLVNLAALDLLDHFTQAPFHFRVMVGAQVKGNYVSFLVHDHVYLVDQQFHFWRFVTFPEVAVRFKKANVAVLGDQFEKFHGFKLKPRFKKVSQRLDAGETCIYRW
jgi:hypothetical protein